MGRESKLGEFDAFFKGKGSATSNTLPKEPGKTI